MQREVVFRTRGTARLPLGVNFGITTSIFEFGKFELWRSRSTSVWIHELKQRVCTPSAFRIVKRQGRIDADIAGLKCRAEFAIIMRHVVVGLDDWAAVRAALIEQVEALGRSKK